MYLVEISFTKTEDYSWSGDFSDLPEELRALVADTVPADRTDGHDPDDLADVINAEITDIDLDLLTRIGADLQSESYEVENITVS